MENVLEFRLMRFTKKFSMKKLILCFVIISGMLFGCKEKKTTRKLSEISISNNGINKIDLGKCITIDSLKTAFPDSTIKMKISEDDGYDYHYAEIKNSKYLINVLMNHMDACLVNEFNVTKSPFPDKFGVKIGMTYEEVKKLRPEIIHKTNYHFHTILSAPNSNLKYEISGTFDGPDKQDFIYDEVKKWKVTQFLIRSY